MDPLVILKRALPGDHLRVTNSNGDTDDVVVDQMDFPNEQIIPAIGNAIAFGDVGKVINESEADRDHTSAKD